MTGQRGRVSVWRTDRSEREGIRLEYDRSEREGVRLEG